MVSLEKKLRQNLIKIHSKTHQIALLKKILGGSMPPNFNVSVNPCKHSHYYAWLRNSQELVVVVS